MAQRIERVLDKLYNLKGENNFVIAEIERNITRAEQTITNATEEQNTNEIKKSDVIGKLTVFNNQKDAFLSAFSDLDDDTFAALRDIGVHADFGTMISSINEKSPDFCNELNEEIKKYEELIESAKETVAEQAVLVAELEENRRNEDDKRNKLISLLEQSLSTEEIEREALSTSYVKKIISAFDLFTEEEVVSLAKIIMFPEDGLIEYNNSYDETVAARFKVDGEEDDSDESENTEPVEPEVEEEKEPVEPKVEEEEEDSAESKEIEEDIIAPVIEENENAIELKPTVEEPVEPEEPTEPETTEEIIDLTSSAEKMYQDVVSSEEVTDIIEKYESGDTTELTLSALNANAGTESEDIEPNEIVAAIEVPEVTETPEVPEKDNDADIDGIIDSLGLESYRVTKELKDLLAQSDYKLIESNYEMLRSAYVNDSVIYEIENNHNYLVDPDFNKKITLLRAKGISETKIKELLEKPKCNLRLPMEELESLIDNVEKMDGKVSNENIYKIDLDTKTYENNKKALADAGYDLEEKEERNYTSVIYTSPYIPDNIKILKDYLISIIKRNSKYALSVFWKNPTELTTDIDDIIEAGLENILETNPEVLEENASELIKRVKYCHENGHQVFVGEDKDLYCDYVISYQRFLEKIGNIDEIFTIENNKNNKISDIIGDKEFIDSILTPLNKYYEDPTGYPEISSEAKEKANNLRQMILNTIGYEDVGKYTYKINDICVSKNKLLRNLEIIIDKLLKDKKEYDGLEREILVTAILYNLRIDENAMKKLVSSCIQGGNK